MTGYAILDLFAGPGGWDTGLRMLGRTDVLGIEWDASAIATARANGHARLDAPTGQAGDGKALTGPDIAKLSPFAVAEQWIAGGQPEGLIASPPCQGFSMAGKGKGRADTQHVLDAVAAIAAGQHPDGVLETLRARCADHRTALVLEPLRWAIELEPDWTCWEQVPAVLPLWEACADVLRAEGYSVWTGNLQAEQYGMIAICPLHADRAPAVPGLSLHPADLASAGTAATPLVEAWLSSVGAGLASEHAANLDSVRRATTPNETPVTLTGALLDAWTVAALARATATAAPDATWRAHVQRLLSRALPERRTPRGRGGASWTSAAMSGSEHLAGPAQPQAGDESTASSWRAFLAALSIASKSYITSTSAPATTDPRISGSSPTTDTTSTSTQLGRSRADCGLCDDTAVAQTRKRAVLIARRHGTAGRPAPTHSRYYPRTPGKLDEGVLPWVTIAQALGGSADDYVFCGAGATSEQTAGQAPRTVGQPAHTITGKGTAAWKLASGTRPRSAMRKATEPAPTIAVGHDSASYVWVPPAATVEDVPRLKATGGSRRASVAEVAALQSFPADYDWQGSTTAQYRQVGDAVPPLLAAHVLAAAGAAPALTERAAS